VDDFVAKAETEDNLIKMINDWTSNVENKGMRVNVNKSNIVISG